MTRLVGYGTLISGAGTVYEGIRTENESFLYAGMGFEVIALLAFASLFLMSFKRPQTA